LGGHPFECCCHVIASDRRERSNPLRCNLGIASALINFHLRLLSISLGQANQLLYKTTKADFLLIYGEKIGPQYRVLTSYN
jgi:hypothetical protein